MVKKTKVKAPPAVCPPSPKVEISRIAFIVLTVGLLILGYVIAIMTLAAPLKIVKGNYDKSSATLDVCLKGWNKSIEDWAGCLNRPKYPGICKLTDAQGRVYLNITADINSFKGC